MVNLASGGLFKGAGAFQGQGFRVEFERPNPGPYEALRDEGVAIRGASVEAVVQTTNEVKQRIRDYIDAHFTNSEFHGNGRRRVSNASAQSVFYDELEEKGQYAGLVYSKFGKRDAGGFVDFLLLHVRGGTLRPKTGDWLRILNPRAGGSASSVAQSGFFPVSQSNIFFAPSSDGKKLFQLRRYRKGSLGSRRGTTELLATLVKRVVFPARLSGIDEIARQRPELFEGYFADALKQRRQQSTGAMS
jgi:hypothetical protein